MVPLVNISTMATMTMTHQGVLTTHTLFGFDGDPSGFRIRVGAFGSNIKKPLVWKPYHFVSLLQGTLKGGGPNRGWFKLFWPLVPNPGRSRACFNDLLFTLNVTGVRLCQQMLPPTLAGSACASVNMNVWRFLGCLRYLGGSQQIDLSQDGWSCSGPFHFDFPTFPPAKRFETPPPPCALA